MSPPFLPAARGGPLSETRAGTNHTAVVGRGGVTVSLRTDEGPGAAGGGAARPGRRHADRVEGHVGGGGVAVVAVRRTSLQPLLDVAVPVLLAVLTVTQLLTDPPRPHAALVTVCALATVLPLAVRRTAPLPVTVVVSAGVVGQVAAAEGVPATFASFVAVMICVYTLLRAQRALVVAAGIGVIVVAVDDGCRTGDANGPVRAVRDRLSAVLLRRGRWARRLRPAARAPPLRRRGSRGRAGERIGARGTARRRGGADAHRA